MKRQTLWIFITFFLLAVFIFPAGLLAAPYYEGKMIKIIVGYSPGGGYDRMARMLAKHLPKHIPGKPTISIENMEGGASVMAANHLYNVAKPDGMTIGTIDQGLAYGQLLKIAGIKFDLRKFAWIGSAAVESTIVALRSDLPYKTVDDMRKAKVIHMGTTGKGSTDYQTPTLLKEFLGINFNMIIYPGSADVFLALERKEVDGRAGSYSSLKPHIDRGLVRPVLRGRVAVSGVENLPVNEDFTTDNTGKTLMAMLSSADNFGRLYVAPPGTPADVMNILRDVFAKVPKDPELIEDSKKNKMPVQYVPADECLKVLEYFFNQPESIVKEFSKYIKY